MISHADMIYHFADIYLQTAMECSICKENYLMADDNDFLDEFMKFFSVLLLAERDNPDMELEELKAALAEKSQDTLLQFDLFMKRQMTQQAIEYAEQQIQKKHLSGESANTEYLNTIEAYMDYVFDSDYDKLLEEPVKLLKNIRVKEENFKKKMG